MRLQQFFQDQHEINSSSKILSYSNQLNRKEKVNWLELFKLFESLKHGIKNYYAVSSSSRCCKLCEWKTDFSSTGWPWRGTSKGIWAYGEYNA